MISKKQFASDRGMSESHTLFLCSLIVLHLCEYAGGVQLILYKGGNVVKVCSRVLKSVERTVIEKPKE